MRRFFRFPEALLLVIVVCVVLDYKSFFNPLCIMLLVSWFVHLLLRISPRFPNFASLFQVLITMACWVCLLYTSWRLNGTSGSKPDPVGVINGLLWGDIAFIAGLFFTMTQVVFWLAGLWVILEKGLLLRRRA